MERHLLSFQYLTLLALAVLKHLVHLIHPRPRYTSACPLSPEMLLIASSNSCCTRLTALSISLLMASLTAALGGPLLPCALRLLSREPALDASLLPAIPAFLKINRGLPQLCLSRRRSWAPAPLGASLFMHTLSKTMPERGGVVPRTASVLILYLFESKQASTQTRKLAVGWN